MRHAEVVLSDGGGHSFSHDGGAVVTRVPAGLPTECDNALYSSLSGRPAAVRSICQTGFRLGPANRFIVFFIFQIAPVGDGITNTSSATHPFGYTAAARIARSDSCRRRPRSGTAGGGRLGR